MSEDKKHNKANLVRIGAKPGKAMPQNPYDRLALALRQQDLQTFKAMVPRLFGANHVFNHAPAPGHEENSQDRTESLPALACRHESDTCISYLLEIGADPNLGFAKGETALLAAAYTGNLAIVRQLIEKGANPKHQNESGRNALANSRASCNPDLVAYLEDLTYGGDKDPGGDS